MNDSLLLLFLLLVKHSIADLAIQHRLVPLPGEKSSLFSLKNALHCLDHAALSFLILLFYLEWWQAALLALAEFKVHYVIDMLKTRIRFAYALTNTMPRFWLLQTVDQVLHYAWYVVMVLIVFPY